MPAVNSGSNDSTTGGKQKKRSRLRPMAPESPNRIPEGEILVVIGKRSKQRRKK
jgi:hypothetical protein